MGSSFVDTNADSDDDDVFVDKRTTTVAVVGCSSEEQPSASQSTNSEGLTVCCVCHDTIKMELYTIVYGSVYCQLCSAQCNVMENREAARVGIKRSADRMLHRSGKKFKKIDVGSSVLVQVPKVDRGPLDHQNIVGKVLNISNNLYQIGTSGGIIDRWLARNCIEFTPFAFTGSIPSQKLSLRELSALASDHGGQGFKKCSCRSQCTTNRCQCRKSNVKCNSRCHSSHSCANVC